MNPVRCRGSNCRAGNKKMLAPGLARELGQDLAFPDQVSRDLDRLAKAAPD